MEHFQETLFVICICFLYLDLELPCVGTLVKKVVSWLTGLGQLTGNKLRPKMWRLFKLI